MATNETLKKQEQEFRNHCKEELARLKGQIEELKASSEEGSSEDNVSKFLVILYVKGLVLHKYFYPTFLF